MVLIILAIAAAYFIYRNNRRGRASLDQTNYLGSNQAPDSAENSDRQNTPARSALHNNSPTQADLPAQAKAAPHDGPSLLYAERKNLTDSNTGLSSSTNSSAENQMTHAENLPIDSSVTAADTMDFTAETATLSSEDVGLPANSNEYEQSNNNEKPLAATQTDRSISQGTIAANAQTHDQRTTHQHQAEHVDQPSDNNQGISAGQVGMTMGAVAAGIAGAAKASADTSPAKDTATNANVGTNSASQQRPSDTHSSTMAHPTSEGIDLELGDSTYNDGQELEDENDELLDFGDLTADISEMLKELNLRESDSPRLEINEEEYQQLKTGDPGEVKPEKIENVAGKLRDMLQ